MATPKAPTARITSSTGDERTDLQNKMNAEHPEYFHTFDKESTTASARRAKGKEIVYEDTYDKEGEHIPMSLRTDVVVRIHRDRWLAERAASNSQSYDRISKIMKKNADKVIDSGGVAGKINDGESQPNEVGKIRPHAGEKLPEIPVADIASKPEPAPEPPKRPVGRPPKNK